MKLLKCKLCGGEVDFIGNDRVIIKKIKCNKCGYTNNSENKEPEVFIIKKRATFKTSK